MDESEEHTIRPTSYLPVRRSTNACGPSCSPDIGRPDRSALVETALDRRVSLRACSASEFPTRELTIQPSRVVAVFDARRPFFVVGTQRAGSRERWRRGPTCHRQRAVCDGSSPVVEASPVRKSTASDLGKNHRGGVTTADRIDRKPARRLAKPW